MPPCRRSKGGRSRVLSAECRVPSGARLRLVLTSYLTRHSALGTRNSLLARALIERGLDLLGADRLAPDDDVEGLADASNVAADEGEADALADRGRVGAASDVADRLAVDLHLVARAGRTTALGH